MYRPDARGALLSALLVFLSIMGKQSQLFLVPVCAIAAGRQRFRWGAVHLAVSLALTAAAVAALNAATNGWFIKYTIGMVSDHQVLTARYKEFPIIMLRNFFLPFAAVFIYGAYLLVTKRFGEFFREPWFYFIGASLIASLAIWRYNGAYLNSFIPGAMAMVAGFAVAAPRLWMLVRGEVHGERRIAAGLLSMIAVAVMLWAQDFPNALSAPLWKQVPSKEHRQTARRFNKFIKNYPGVVILPFHTLPSNPDWRLPHNVGLRDLQGSDWGRRYHRGLLKELKERRIDAFIFKGGRIPWRFRAILKDYKRQRLPRELRADPGPLTPWPKWIYTRKDADKPAPPKADET
ncbi:MAG: hypothetical protein M5R36_03635 [Deltaproteobacteria bacterium]|nr:hypothetical protein [Deltaproteobacteria bacterium]